MPVSDAPVVDGDAARDKHFKPCAFKSIADKLQQQSVHEDAAGEGDGADAGIAADVFRGGAGRAGDGLVER